MSDINADERAFFQEAFFSNCEMRSSCLKLDEKPAATLPDYGPISRKLSRSSRTLWKVLLPLQVLIQANSISAAPQ
jgi:hypothetical protein